MGKCNKKSLTLRKQQWAKFLSNYIAEGLRKSNPNSPLKKAYMNTYNCNAVKHYDGDKLRGTYCKNRWCITCNRIRTAVNILNYGAQISAMGQPFFVTLTRKTCTEEELPTQMKKFEEDWRKIYNYSKMKKKEPYKNGIRLIGIRSMECTLRPDNRYHYHYHFIIDGWNNAEWLRSQWLRRNPDSSPNAQDVRIANAGAMLELFKYAVKLSKELLNEKPNFKRLDAVFRAFKGKRTLSAFGGIKTAKNDEDFDLESQEVKDLHLRFGNDESIWKWNKEIYDWMNVETGELLIGENIPEKILKFAKK